LQECQHYNTSKAYITIQKLHIEREAIRYSKKYQINDSDKWDEMEEREKNIKNELARLSLYTFSDGVKVTNMPDLQRVQILMNGKFVPLAPVRVEVSLMETQRLRVQVLDYRFGYTRKKADPVVRFSQELEVPPEFVEYLASKYQKYKLYAQTIDQLKKVLVEREVHSFDRRAKLLALQKVIL
jgi:hypothetical protein